MMNEGVKKVKQFKKANKYFSKHVWYGHLVHLVIGVGIGVLITYPFVVDHPVRWGAILIALGLAGHLPAFMEK